MQYIALGLIGLVVGVLARWFYPGAVPLGLVGSAFLGIAGSYVAGFIAVAFHSRFGDRRLPRASFLYSILGAMLLIFIGRLLGKV